MNMAMQFFTRMEEEIGPEYTDYYCIPHLEDEKRVFHIQMQIHKAHVIMLEEEDIIFKEEASCILRVIRDLDERGPSALSMNPKLHDLYTNTEAFLINTIGEDIGGKIHTARSRNDLQLTASRLYVRQQILTLCSSLLTLQRTLLQISSEHIDTIMPGFTHYSQHAQPITYAHFLLANVETFARDFRRLRQAYDTTNLSPMGAAALATSGFPINRKRVADLLGFDAILGNSVDSISSRDFQLQAAFAFCTFLSNVSRLNEDILLWNSREFGLVELPDSFASISTIMPQKKNPVTLETIRADSMIAPGYLNSMFGIINHITLGNGREPGYLDHCFYQISDRAIGISKILPILVKHLRVNRDRMKLSAAQGYSTLTELADTIVREKGLSFRTAHKIVGRIVHYAMKKGINADEISSSLIDEVSIEVIGKPLRLNPDHLKNALDPELNITIRSRPGGPAPKEVEKAIETNLQILREMEKELEEIETKLSGARGKLDQIVSSYTI